MNKWTSKADEELRPWINNEEYDQRVTAERIALADSITRTSYSRNAGAVGSSELDPRPQELSELADILHEALENEGGNGIDPQSDMFVDCDENELNLEENCDEFADDAIVDQIPKKTRKIRAFPAIANISTAHYRRILKSMQETNSTLSTGDISSDVKQIMKILPKQFTGKRLQISESVDLASTMITVHRPGTKYGEWVDRDRDPTSLGIAGSKTDGNGHHTDSKDAKDGDAKSRKPPMQGIFSNTRTDGDDSDIRTEFTSKGSKFTPTLSADTVLYATPRVSATDELLQRLNRPASVGLHMIHSARRDEPIVPGLILPSRDSLTTAGNQSNVTVTTDTARSNKSFFVTMLTDDMEPSQHQPLDRAANHSHTNSNPNNNGSIPGTPGNGTARRPGTSGGGINNNNTSRPNTSSGRPTTSSGRPTTSSGSGKGLNNTGIASKSQPALNKLTISTDSGTAETFARRKINQVRSLRDQLQTASGRESMSARLALLESLQQDGGDSLFYQSLSSSSPNNANTYTAERLATQKMVHETKLKNATDQTWPIFVTPGFQEVVGAENVYCSHTKRTFSPSKTSSGSRSHSSLVDTKTTGSERYDRK